MSRRSILINMPGNTRRSSLPRRIFSTAITVISPATKSNSRSNWSARSTRSSISVAASAAACRTCAKSFRKPKSSAAILLPKVSPLRARKTRPAVSLSMDELGPDAKFDLVIASCVFHHIPPQDRQMAIRYCYSRLKEGGHFIIFEHNPINPVTRHLVKNCPVRRGRGAAEHARDGRPHAQRASQCRRIKLLPVLPATARGASPVREISSVAADGRTIFRLRFQSKARCRLIAVFVSWPGRQARSETF